MLTSIKNTLRRLSGKIYIFNPVKWYPLLLEGLSIEFGRLKDFKDKVYNSTVPHSNMDVDSIDDNNKKYGIPSTLVGTDAVKIARIIEKANLNGFPGPEWLQEQIQLAGFQLYVVENNPPVDPVGIPGELCVGSPPAGIGKSLDPNTLNPQPFVYTKGVVNRGFYFTLSPFDGSVALDKNDFLSITPQELDYLCKLIIQLKMQRNWCILQADSRFYSEIFYRTQGDITTAVTLFVGPSSGAPLPAWLLYGSTTYGGGFYAPAGYYQSDLISKVSKFSLIEWTASGDANDIRFSYRYGPDEDNLSAWSAEVDAIGSGSQVLDAIYFQYRFIFHSTYSSDPDNVVVDNII